MSGDVSGLLDRTAARLPSGAAAYFWLFLGWVVTLWFLSAGDPTPKHGLEIPHIDKVAHFLYFFAGGALLAAYGGLRWPKLSGRVLYPAVVVVCCVIGRLDEYHQSFTPGRSGNDTGDWIADTLGGAAGGLAVIRLMLSRIAAVGAGIKGESPQKPA